MYLFRYSLICLLILLGLNSFAQEKVIDTSDLKLWNYSTEPEISDNGDYIFILHTDPFNNQSLTILSTFGKWKHNFSGAFNANFSDDSKWALFQKANDTLVLLKLGTEFIKEIPGVTSYQLPKNGDNNWVAFKTTANSVVSLNLMNFEQHEFKNVGDYLLHAKAKLLVLQNDADTTLMNRVRMVDLPTMSTTEIWSSNQSDSLTPSSFTFSESGDDVAFLVNYQKKSQPFRSLWCFKKGMSKAEEKVGTNSEIIKEGFSISDLTPTFYREGAKLCFYVSKNQDEPSNKSIEITSYADVKLQSQIESQRANEGLDNYRVSLNIHTSQTVLIEHENAIASFPDQNDALKYVLVEKADGDRFEINWNPASQESYYLLDCDNGTKKIIREGISDEAESVQLSPTGKWIVYFNKKENNFFTYEISTGITRNITGNVPVTWLNHNGWEYPIPTLSSSPLWIENDKGILLSDGDNDMWLIDPFAIKAPRNLTKGYGIKHSIKFTVAFQDEQLREISSEKGWLLLAAFNEQNKMNGFYKIALDSALGPQKLTMGNYLYYWPYIPVSSSAYPIKAKNSEVYIVKRMNISDAPNFFVTKDFINYNQITFDKPHDGFNWMTSELLHWKTFDGKVGEGVIYKPENFDAKKKYPVVIYFYERLTDKLNEYEDAKSFDGPINIPWLTSRGFIVFTPDIHYVIGKPGESAYNFIVSGAQYLSKFPWVDSLEIGIDGHSFGGYEVNYVVTKTKMFAAAMDAAGPTDFISDYGSLSHIGRTRTWLYELNQSRIGKTLWERPDLYIDNSPVLKANNVQTPILIMHNKKDDKVPWSEGDEWFNAFRRLGKRAWMLQYKNGGHGVSGDDAIDYTLRVTQFFDHYLKRMPAPKWMTTSSFELRSGKEGYELDPSGNCGKDCKICKMWNEKYKKDSVATMKEIEERSKSENW